MWCVAFSSRASQTYQSRAQKSKRKTTSQPSRDYRVHKILLFRHQNRDSFQKKLHSWRDASSSGEHERAEIGLLDLVNSCFVFAIFLLFRFVEKTFVWLVEVTSGQW